MKNSIVIIPSRLDAKRLPKKPLTLINGIPMIVHVLNRAKAANVGQVFVATPDSEIAEVVKKSGGDAILTENKHMTGSDRVFEAFNKLENNFQHQLIFDALKISLNSWVEIAQSKDKKKIKLIDMPNPGYNNLILIQKVFAHCYISSVYTEQEFKRITENKESNFSRYNFFFANYLLNNNKETESAEFINLASEKYPGNLLINQFKKNLNSNKEKTKIQFNCTNSSDVMGEIFYIFANALSSQRDYNLSNFYISLSKFLNPASMV